MNARYVRLVVGATIAAAVVGVALAAGSNGHEVREVRPGESIQAAIDKAGPGDTVVVDAGVYRENVSIRKGGITVRGAGAGTDGTVLKPPTTPHPSDCDEGGEVVGICIAGAFVPGKDELGPPISGTRVSGFRVEGFSRFGIVVYNAADTTVSDTDVSRSGHFGIAAMEVQQIRLLDNTSHDNGQSGFYVADAGNADALIRGNTSYGNTSGEGVGIFLRDVARGVVAGNRIDGNCGGLLVVDSAEPNRATDWMIRGNTIRRNTASCGATDDVPVALSGFGIALLGTTETTVERQQRRWQPAERRDSRGRRDRARLSGRRRRPGSDQDCHLGQHAA